MNLQNIEEAWRIKCKGVKAQNEASSAQDVQKELDELKLHYKRLKEEHDTFRDLADRMIEEKDKEIYKLLDDNKDLHQSLESRPPVDHNGNHYTPMQKQDAQNLSTSAAEQQILLLARQQAQKEEELPQSQWHILALQEEIEELDVRIVSIANSSEKPTGCWTDLWCVPAKRQVVGKELELAAGAYTK